MLEWLDTPAGRRYLNNQMSRDMAEGSSVRGKQLPESDAEAPFVPSDDLFRRISQTIHEDLFSQISHAEDTVSGKKRQVNKYASMKFVPSMQTQSLESAGERQAQQSESQKTEQTVSGRVASGSPSHKRYGKQPLRSDGIGLFIKVAAVLMVALSAWGIYRFAYETIEPEELVASSGVVFHTAADEQRRIRLTDGTVIRLNGRSEVKIDQFNGDPGRHVELKGEAFFEVAYNPEKPFYVHANNSLIKVLGTSFNVSSFEEKEYVQVSVLQGRVAFSKDHGQPEDTSITLDSGQSARLDTRYNRLEREPYGAENATAWFTRRLRFNAQPFEHVCSQLSHLYDLQCVLEHEELRELRLTSDFSIDSLEKTLSVIAMTLEIDYTFENDTVFWRHP